MASWLAEKPGSVFFLPGPTGGFALLKGRMLRAGMCETSPGPQQPGPYCSCSSTLCPATSPCFFPDWLKAQPFITGMLYSDRSVSIYIIT